jgi:hypothetical protein
LDIALFHVKSSIIVPTGTMGGNAQYDFWVDFSTLKILQE